MRSFRLPNEFMLSESERKHLRKCVTILSKHHLSPYLGPYSQFPEGYFSQFLNPSIERQPPPTQLSRLFRRAVWSLNAAISRWTPLGRPPWSVTCAEFLDVDLFLSHMRGVRENYPSDYDALCEAIGSRKRIGRFDFQLPRTLDMHELPPHWIGRSLTIVTDQDEIKPLWFFVGLLVT